MPSIGGFAAQAQSQDNTIVRGFDTVVLDFYPTLAILHGCATSSLRYGIVDSSSFWRRTGDAISHHRRGGFFGIGAGEPADWAGARRSRAGRSQRRWPRAA